MGNVLLTTPLIERLHRSFPDARIDWLVAARYASLVQHPSQKIHLIPFEKRDLFRRPWAWLGQVISLRRTRYDGAVDATHEHARSTTGLLLTFFSGAPVRVGHSRGDLDRFYTHLAPVSSPHLHELIRKQQLAMPIELKTSGSMVESTWMTKPSEDALRLIEQWAVDNNCTKHECLLVWPCARKPDRRWPLRDYAVLIDEIRNISSLKVVIGWGPGEKPRAEALAEMTDSLLAPETDPLELSALMRHACAAVSNDTGPMHLAAASGVPVFCLVPDKDGLRWGYATAPHHAQVIDENGLASPKVLQACGEWLKGLEKGVAA